MRLRNLDSAIAILTVNGLSGSIGIGLIGIGFAILMYLQYKIDPAAIANQGIWHKPYSIKRILDLVGYNP